jgi:hypothetical protein
MSERPPISGSMALHCRAELFLNAHGYKGEPILPGTQRTFDVGTIIEAVMLRGVLLGDLEDENGIVIVPWWKNLGEVKDAASGRSFTAADCKLSDFQREVTFAGVKGHLDALVDIDGLTYVLDVKTTQNFGYKRHLTGDLLEDPFAREYVGQLHFYMAGLIAEGVPIAGGVLLFFNKEQSHVMCRFVDYDQSVVDEIEQRLKAANGKQFPTPDWVWREGEEIPLRSRYCSQKHNCAKMRGFVLELSVGGKNGSPTWRALRG